MRATCLLVFVVSVVFVRSAPTTEKGNGKTVDVPNVLSVWKHFDETFNRMHKEMSDMSRQMEQNFNNVFPVQKFKFAVDIPNVDPKQVKNETFTEEKVVDHHVVNTKEDVYSDGKNTVVHSRRVIITPEDSKDHKTKKVLVTNVVSKDVEEVENPEESMDLLGSPSIEQETYVDVLNELTDASQTTPIPQTVEIDLSGDTNVNTIAENHIREPEPDAELIENNQINSNTNNPNQNTYNPNNYKYSVL